MPVPLARGTCSELRDFLFYCSAPYVKIGTVYSTTYHSVHEQLLLILQLLANETPVDDEID